MHIYPKNGINIANNTYTDISFIYNASKSIIFIINYCIIVLITLSIINEYRIILLLTNFQFIKHWKANDKDREITVVYSKGWFP